MYWIAVLNKIFPLTLVITVLLLFAFNFVRPFWRTLYIKEMEKRYQVEPTDHILAEYCWTIVRDNEDCTY